MEDECHGREFREVPETLHQPISLFIFAQKGILFRVDWSFCANLLVTAIFLP